MLEYGKVEWLADELETAGQEVLLLGKDTANARQEGTGPHLRLIFAEGGGPLHDSYGLLPEAKSTSSRE